MARVWDVDSLEDEIPVAMIAEWNEFLNWELAQYAEAILGAIPAGGSVAAEAGNVKYIKDPEEIAGFLDSLNTR